MQTTDVTTPTYSPDLSRNQQLEDFSLLHAGWFWETDENLRYTYLSGRFSEITGIPTAFALGETDESIGVTEQDPEAWRKHQRDVDRRRSFRDFKYTLLHPDGRTIVVSVNGDAIRNQAGDFRGYRGTTTEVTGQIQTNDAIQHTRTLYQLAGRIAKLSFWEWDEVTDECIYCSDELAKLHGVSVEEYVRRSRSNDGDWQWIHPDDRERYEQAAKDFVNNKAGFEIEYRLVNVDGKIIDAYEVAAPVCDIRGDVVRSIGFVRDITKHKKAEAELHRVADSLRRARDELNQRVRDRTTELHEVNRNLQESERRLREAARIARLGHFKRDVIARRSIYIDEEVADILGVPHAECINESLDNHISRIHPEDRERVRTSYEESYAHAGLLDIEYRVIRPDGNVRYVYEHSNPIVDANECVVQTFGVVQDITERKMAENALQHARKLEAVGRLTGGVAHDFNNLLAVVLGNCRLLQGRLAPDDESLLRDVIHAGSRGATLTHRLLAFSRRQALRPVETDINSLIENMFELLSRTLGATISIDMTLAACPKKVMVDPDLLESAILNLALNARDAMPNGGMLCIQTLEESVQSSKHTDLMTGETDHQMSIIIQDTGIGMAPDLLARALEPFVTTKDAGQGSGLGLPMAFGFAKQSNGDFLIESEEGKGTKVTLTLPYLHRCAKPDD